MASRRITGSSPRAVAEAGPPAVEAAPVAGSGRADRRAVTPPHRRFGNSPPWYGEMPAARAYEPVSAALTGGGSIGRPLCRA